MPNPVWPATLPQYVNQDGFKEQYLDNTVRTQFDGGTMKIRRRYTAVPLRYTMNLTLTAAQKTILDGFFLTTTKSGSLAWDWVKPAEQTSATFVFTTPPQYAAAGPQTFIAQIEVQTVP